MEQSLTNQPMVEKEKMFAAVDIGTTKIVALVGYLNEDRKVTILGIGESASAGVAAGSVVSISQTAEDIKKAVQMAEKEAGFFPKKVVVGVAGRHIRSTSISVNHHRVDASAPITEEELQDNLISVAPNQVLRGAGEEIIHVVLQNYLVDGEVIKNPVGYANGSNLVANFHVILGETEKLQWLMKSVEMAGLETSVDLLCLEPIASSNAVLTDSERKSGVAMVDMGGGTTDIAIYYDNCLCTTEVVPFGGKCITKDIMAGCGVLEEQAEALKVEYGSAICEIPVKERLNIIIGDGYAQKEVSSEFLAGIINARIMEIINGVQYTLYVSGYSDKISSIVVTGGAANLKYLTNLLALVLRKPSSIKTPVTMLNYGDSVVFNNPKYSTVAGLMYKSAEVWKEEQKKAKDIQDPVPTPESTPVSNETIGTPKKGLKNHIKSFFGMLEEKITAVSPEYNECEN